MKDPTQYRDYYNSNDSNRWGRTGMDQEAIVTREWLAKMSGIRKDLRILELGSGIGALKNVHPKHIGLEFSLSALQYCSERSRLVNGDMQRLPFCDESIDFIFSWAALEHVPRPELVLSEIERVLIGGGICLLAPAWNVRSWAGKALPIRSFSELAFNERISKATIPIRNTLLWRSLFAFPGRVRREFSLLRCAKPFKFDYRRLSPNLFEHTYTDCDAFTSMDPHAAISYYAVRGWRVLSHPTFISRFLARHEPVVVQKTTSP